MLASAMAMHVEAVVTSSIAVERVLMAGSALRLALPLSMSLLESHLPVVGEYE